MAAVTAEDIRMVAARVRAADRNVAPCDRNEPYDLEVFEPLMKMLPKEPVPYHPPPQRPDETDAEYYVVWRHHFNTWLLEKIVNYFKVKGGRLLSPSSDIDDNDDVRSQGALRNQQKLLRGLDIVDYEYFRKPYVYDESAFAISDDFWEKYIEATRGMKLPDAILKRIAAYQSRKAATASSSSGYQEPGQCLGSIRRSIEDGAGPAAERQEMDGSILYPSIERSPEREQSGDEMEASRSSSPQCAEPTRVQKRRSLPVEDNALERPLKKQRTDKHPQLSTASNTAGRKRQRDGEELLDQPSSTGESEQPSHKKRRVDSEWKIQPSRKRKKSSQEIDEESQVSQLGYEVPETKRRRVSKVEVTDAEQSVQNAPIAADSGHTPAIAPSLRITRARWQQLSGEDAQLLQLDQRGRPNVQKPKHAAQAPARELLATSRNSRRPKKAASLDVNNSRKTKNHPYHLGQHEGLSAKASTTVNSTTKTTTKTIARTRYRSASSKTRGKGGLSFT
ncbi:hypothetical protein V8C35DRAFT_119169 [Trichoderma chlorosporum]